MDKQLEEFEKVRLILIQSLNDFPKERREEVLFDKWSLKDVVAHLSGWMSAAANNIKSLKEGQTPLWVESIDKFNQDNVEKRRDWGWERLHQELVEVSNEFVQEYRGLPEELWEKKYWPNRSFTPKKILEIELKHWRDSHQLQLTKFISS